MQLALGSIGALVAALLFLLVNIPGSAGSVAPELLPGFWRFLNHFRIGGAEIDANRSILYFGGSGVAEVLKILVFPPAGAVLLAIPIQLRNRGRTRTREPALPWRRGVSPKSDRDSRPTRAKRRAPFV
jgi:hypothetical protein